MMGEHAPVLAVVIPLLFAFLTPLVGLVRKNLCFYWAVSALVLCVGTSSKILISVIENGPIRYRLGGWAPPYGIEYTVDHLNAMMLILVCVIGLAAAVYSRRSVLEELSDRIVYFYTLFLLQVTGFLGIVVTGDLFNLYVFLEIASLAGYALIAIGDEGAPWACFRYIVMGTIGACFYLLGIGYLYMVTGTLNMADMRELLPGLYHSKVVLTAASFILAGLAVKMALFPLHTWLPDSYTKAPSPVSALIAPLMTKIALYVMIRILFTVFEPRWSIDLFPVTRVITWAGVAAICAGAVMALAQTDFKRMLCFILVAEVGYIAGGVGLANETAFRGAVLHILNDSVMTAALFTVAGILTYKHGRRRLKDFRYMFKKMPVTMSAFVVAALSMIGVPPTCGFFSKWYLIQGAVTAGHWAFMAALVGSSLVNVILFFRIIEIGYVFEESHGHGVTESSVAVLDEAPLSMLVPTVSLAVFILAIGIFNQSVLESIVKWTVPGF